MPAGWAACWWGPLGLPRLLTRALHLHAAERDQGMRGYIDSDRTVVDTVEALMQLGLVQ